MMTGHEIHLATVHPEGKVWAELMVHLPPKMFQDVLFGPVAINLAREDNARSIFFAILEKIEAAEQQIGAQP